MLIVLWGGYPWKYRVRKPLQSKPALIYVQNSMKHSQYRTNNKYFLGKVKVNNSIENLLQSWFYSNSLVLDYCKDRSDRLHFSIRSHFSLLSVHNRSPSLCLFFFLFISLSFTHTDCISFFLEREGERERVCVCLCVCWWEKDSEKWGRC